MNRLDRLTSILIQLQSKRVVRAQEIAERFGISLRTVYRDVRSLETAGVPIVGEAGVGYSMIEGYRLPPVHFSREEAAAFLTAEKLVEPYTDAGLAAQYKAGLMKIRAVLRFPDKDYLEPLDEAVLVLKKQAASPEQWLPVLLQAISQKELLSMLYAGKKDEKAIERRIEPIGVYFQHDRWNVVAWCRLREDLRNFRVDRIQQLRQTGHFFEDRALSLQQYLEENENPTGKLQASITAPDEVLPYIERQKAQQGFVSQHSQNGQTEMHFQTASYSYLARWAMQFADKVISLSPPALEEEFRGILRLAKINFTS